MRFTMFLVCFMIASSIQTVYTTEMREGKKFVAHNQPIILTATTGFDTDADDPEVVSQTDRSPQSLAKHVGGLRDSKAPFVPPTFITGAHLLQSDMISEAGLPGVSKAQSIYSTHNTDAFNTMPNGNIVQSDEAVYETKPINEFEPDGMENYEEEEYSDYTTANPSLTAQEFQYNTNEESIQETFNPTSYIDDFESMGLPPLDQQNQPVIPAHVAVRSSVPWAQRDTSQGQPRHIACTQTLDRGLGPDEVSSWYYDSQDGRCRWFGYRGYGGNANRFYSRSSCEGLCIHDKTDLCETVTCIWPSTSCQLVGDQSCKDYKQQRDKSWESDCPPDQPVCVSRRNTRMAPDINFDRVPPECLQESDPGSCEKKNPSVNFFYDRERNDCMAFYFHDCGGNDNRFETKSECMTHCSP